jgi:protein MpaA
MNEDERSRRCAGGLILALMMLFAVGCARRESEMEQYGLKEPISPVNAPCVKSTARPTAPPVAGSSETILLGSSVQGRPINMQVFGQPLGTPVLIMGAIHGDETTSADLTKNLVQLLGTHSDLTAGKRVAVITVANPDGLAAGTRVNANRVDVNRNFPASNYRAGRASSTNPRYGASAGSEPETRAIMAALEQVHPRLLISIHSITDGRQCNNYDGPAKAIAELMSARNKYPPTATIGYPTPGSLGSYAGIDRQVPMITLELPRDLPAEKAWAQNREALLAAIAAAK